MTFLQATFVLNVALLALVAAVVYVNHIVTSSMNIRISDIK